MKKIVSIVLLVVMLAGVLTSCSFGMSSPEVKEGKFDVSFTYKVKGETKTLDLVYVCEYDGVEWTLEGTSHRAWDGHFEGYKDGDVIEVCKTDDGGRIVLGIHITPEYFMGDPDYSDYDPFALTNFIYYEDGDEMIDDDQTIIAEKYGVKVIGIECDDPIENVFK